MLALLIQSGILSEDNQSVTPEIGKKLSVSCAESQF